MIKVFTLTTNKSLICIFTFSNHGIVNFIPGLNFFITTEQEVHIAIHHFTWFANHFKFAGIQQ
ncbi:hypothetical protein NZ35_17155 [Pseudomonas chlororaphis]|uniref:Uncharacterized protein n=1 Tax=Pseudomonas chlororaphis TaxID=587753 RepID=A0A0A6D8H7_9PSED|nr:hypothetical protein NZ35_17155 [Pseudomonas chlororaphis]